MVVAALVATTSVAATSPAFAEGRPGYGGAVVGTLLGEAASFDPVAVRTHADAAVVGLLFDTLYDVGPDGVVYPQLAAALPDVQADKARISLRPEARFHDGSALTAVDVVATLARVRASAAAGWLLVSVNDIAVDGDDVVLTLDAPRKDLARLLATPWTAITPRGLAPRKDAPVGSGPFRLSTRKRDRLETEHDRDRDHPHDVLRLHADPPVDDDRMPPTGIAALTYVKRRRAPAAHLRRAARRRAERRCLRGRLAARDSAA